MNKWEYTAVIAEVQAKHFGEGVDTLLNELNQLGQDGWEICTSSEVTGANWSNQITVRTNLIFLKRVLA